MRPMTEESAYLFNMRFPIVMLITARDKMHQRNAKYHAL